jgi:hypothetical protein
METFVESISRSLYGFWGIEEITKEAYLPGPMRLLSRRFRNGGNKWFSISAGFFKVPPVF